MKKIILLTVLSFLLFSCTDNGANSTEAIIESGNLAKMKERRTALQNEITGLDAAIAAKDTINVEALVGVATVKDTVFTHYLEVQGNVATDQNIIIYPQFSGVLTSLNVKAGQSVSKGQVLGRIDDGGLSQQVAQLEAQLALSQTTFERQKRLWDQKIGSEIQFLQAQTDMQSRQKAVAQVRAQLSKTVVRAPFSGVIDEIITDRGQVVNPQQGLMRIVNLSNMYITTTVPEAYIGKVKAGTPVIVDLSSLGKTYLGKVRQVASSINPSNRSFGVEVSVPDTDKLLRPNQVVKLKITDYKKDSAIVVPANVIQKDADGANYVYVVASPTDNAGTAKKVMVKTGQTSENFTEILSGLNVNDIIVTEGVSNISEGAKLNF